MATVISQKLVEELIKSNGEYPDDPPVFTIVEYQTPEGEKVWSLCYSLQDFWNTLGSPFVLQPCVIFVRNAAEVSRVEIT